MTEKHNPVKVKIQVQWLPRPVNWVKLNSDGSSMGNPGLAGGGGLIRNERGKWINGYARAIGITTSVAMKHGCVSGLGYGCGCGCGTRQFLKKVGAGAAGLGD